MRAGVYRLNADVMNPGSAPEDAERHRIGDATDGVRFVLGDGLHLDVEEKYGAVNVHLGGHRAESLAVLPGSTNAVDLVPVGHVMDREEVDRHVVQRLRALRGSLPARVQERAAMAPGHARRVSAAIVEALDAIMEARVERLPEPLNADRMTEVDERYLQHLLEVEKAAVEAGLIEGADGCRDHPDEEFTLTVEDVLEESRGRVFGGERLQEKGEAPRHSGSTVDPPYAQASKLTASWQGTDAGPPMHAVPHDAPRNDARSVCGVEELVVLEEHDGRPPFDPEGAYVCKRCTRILRAKS